MSDRSAKLAQLQRLAHLCGCVGRVADFAPDAREDLIFVAGHRLSEEVERKARRAKCGTISEPIRLVIARAMLLGELDARARLVVS